MSKKTSIFSNKKLIMFFLLMIIILPLFEPYLKSQEGLSELFKIEEGQEITAFFTIICVIILIIIVLAVVVVIIEAIVCAFVYCPPPQYSGKGSYR